ncbi:alcohol dehydrogenase [Lasiodiplodia theobromae]|uniref:alcohol dehydrogenase n=1 Tax=Lasiodiplodia theobromae TaxID=45133 RepID=UPI0015C3EE5F|nr:alcohol dehydrogenase [Lasiodiplodia theobromae]KAF4540662.1 alcohol dehydrogenase [Lasiodiplodia theobromae]
MTKNQAAWITEAKSRPLKVDEASNWKAGAGEVLIKNAAVAINPVDWKIQDFAGLPLPYPNILGSDLAGVIEEVGKGVSHLKKGDRVMAFSPSIATGNPANGAYQRYTVVPETLVSPIPDHLPFEQAAVLPLALSTAAAALYEDKNFNLPLPTATADGSGTANGTNENKGTIIIWGAAGSVGLTAIQLARLSGLRVVGVASARNHDLVKSVGAHEVLDYRAAGIGRDVAAAIAEAGEGRFVGILDAVSSPDTFSTIDTILNDVVGAPIKVVALMPIPEGVGRNFVGSHCVSFSIMKPPYEHIADGLWRKFIPEALARGLIKAKPDPLVVGSGLGSIQDAMDRQKAGVSAQKIVVTL